MNATQTRDMFLHVAGVMIDSEEFLTEIDNKIGDGDHGIGMSTGFKGIKKELEGQAFEFVNDVFHTIGMTMLCVMGGASGVLFGTVFISGIVGYENKSDFTLEDFGNVFTTSLAALQKRGKAQVGDKTMIDALEPAVKEMYRLGREGRDIVSGFALSAEAAQKGMEYTKTCKARFGRAKYYGEKAIGLQDAGATSVYIIFDAMAKWAKENL